MVVCLCFSSKFTDCIGAPLVCTGPHTKCNAVEGVLRILLQDERMVQALGLTSASDELDIMWKASLGHGQPILAMQFVGATKAKTDILRTLMAACSDLAISLSWSIRGLLPRISGSQNCPTAPFICWTLPCAGCGARTHCDGSLPTPQTM